MMADAPMTRLNRLRPIVGRFDLRINRNRFGLIRHTIKRATDKNSKRILKSEMAMQLDSNNNAHTVPNEAVPIFAVKKEVSMAIRKWNWPDNKPYTHHAPEPESLYDTSKIVRYESMDEETLFETFNQLSLNELCQTADVCAELKFATQKFFEVIYSRVKLDWLIDDGNGKFTLLQARRLLQCFGPFISTIIVNTDHLDNSKDETELLALIGKHCNGVLFWNSE